MTTTSSRGRRTTAAFLIAGAATLNVAFLGLGAVFDYPAVLDHPATQVLAAFRENQGAVIGWFLVLALGAALLAPIAVLVGYSCNASQPNDLAANESAMQKAFHEGDRVFCGLHIDDIVIVQAEQ